MIGYILMLFAFFSLYHGITIILKKHMDFNPKKILEGAHPIWYKKGKKGVLLVHGFTSSPWEFTELAKHLKEKGITVYAPLLKGHGTSPENLATTTQHDWIESARKGYRKLKKECDEVHIVGTSLGGNIAIILASTEKVDSLILLGTPFFFRMERAWKATYHFLRLFKSFKKKGKVNRKHRLRLRKGYYERVPLNVLKYCSKLIQESRDALSHVSCRTLVMQSDSDTWVHERSVKYIKTHIQTKDISVIWVENAYHVIIMEKESKNYNQTILEFIKK